jgi:hypothetical protein
MPSDSWRRITELTQELVFELCGHGEKAPCPMVNQLAATGSFSMAIIAVICKTSHLFKKVTLRTIGSQGKQPVGSSPDSL